MILRLITFVGAILGATGLSQFPEYAQQYEQRLAGAVDELRLVVADFDATLADLGQTREQAFAPNQNLSPRETAMLGNAKSHIERLAYLEDALDRLRTGSVFDQMVAVPLVADVKIAQRAFADFKPAVPISVQGFASAGLGFVAGWIVVGLLIWCLGWPFRRRKARDSYESIQTI